MTQTPRRPSSALVAAEPAALTLPHRVSVVVPAYNEGAHIAPGLEELRRVLASTGWDFEIIVIDDGSADDTAAAAAAAGVRVFQHRRNRGYGAALKTGIAAAEHPWILITDADGTYPAKAIPLLLAAADHNDMVVGARTGQTVRIPLVRRPAKWFLKRLASYLAGQNLPDLNSGLRLMRKDLLAKYLHLLPSGFSFTTTITLAAACNEHDVEYVSIDYHARLGQSKIRPWHAYEFTLLILRTIVFFNPLKVFIPLGAMLMLAGMAKFAYDVTRNNLSESAIFAMLTAMLFWAVGLLADQNSRMAMRR
ncbi:MAG: glycosyltransferase family 2 protein [Longimicrobiales bacterium]